MTHTYSLTGMTCGGCEASVKSKLLKLPEITQVDLSKDTNSATILMTQHISVHDLQEAIGGNTSKYQITTSHHNEATEEIRLWFETYKPIILIFGYITLVSVLAQVAYKSFDTMLLMRHFMAGFFLVFSFFKLLNLKGFAESYAMYDVLAKRIPSWGYVYAFVELGLGLAYLVNFNPYFTNVVTLAIMSLSIIGVLQSVINKKKIQCACLGAVFNLPMSTVTIIEDALMIVMSGVMLINLTGLIS